MNLAFPSKRDQQKPAQLLLAGLIRPEMSGDECLALSESLDDAGWRVLVRNVRHHGIAGLVLPRMHEIGIRLPAVASDRLEEASQRAIAHGLRLQRETRCAVEVLHGAGCGRIAPMKGIYLLPCLYGRVGARNTNDADLLIPVEDRERAHHALLDAGFTYIPKPPDRSASQRAGYERSYLSTDRILIDVHTAFCQHNRVGLNYDAMWGRTEEDPRLAPWGTGLKALDPIDTLLILALHPAQDCYQGVFRQYVDFAWWLDRRQPDLAEAGVRAEAAGAKTALWIALWLAKEQLGVHVDGAILNSLCPGPIRRVYLQSLLGRRPLTPLQLNHIPRMAQILTLFPVMDGFSRRMRFAEEYIRLRMRDFRERKSLRDPGFLS